MTQKDKELLLKDLSARFPYGVIVYDYDREETREMGLGTLHDIMFNDLECKPYLRPMSSMTEEEKEEFNKIKESVEAKFINAINDDGFTLAYYELIDWLNKHHFDYRGLIFSGLALEAKDGMYNNIQ